MTDMKKLYADIEEAAALRHSHRAMRVLLECGHLRLMSYLDSSMGIGAYTSCGVCPRQGANFVTRMVVDVAETGVLWSESMSGLEPR